MQAIARFATNDGQVANRSTGRRRPCIRRWLLLPLRGHHRSQLQVEELHQNDGDHAEYSITRAIAQDLDASDAPK